MTQHSYRRPMSAFDGDHVPILIVEDELLIRLMIGEELRDAGYRVIEAANAHEALSILNSGVRIDLVLSDVRMPGTIDGLDLLSAIRSFRPTLPIIIMSGHLEPEIAESRGASRFVAKPFELGSIVSAINEELGKTA